MDSQPPSSSRGSSQPFDQHNAQLQAAALKATRSAAALPADINFYRSVDPALAQDIDAISSRVLHLTNRLLGLSSSADPQTTKGKGKAKLRNEDDVVDNFQSLVVDVMDQLFERTDTCLDQVLGRNKAPAIAINPPASTTVAAPRRKAATHRGHLDPTIHHASHLTKPQLAFKRKADNSDTPWYPTLSHKYNAKVSLGYVYTDEDDNVNSSSTVTNHPYRYEIKHIQYPPHVYTATTPIHPAPLSETPFTWVATVEALQAMLDKLRTSKEIAVDLEHHSYRSYAGFLCLMQLSTREEDWIVDVIALRDEMEVMNEVFTDPSIVKVFHGAESDIVWLQQDFNLYVVNMFDTFHASKLLEFPRHGLANLLEMYCDYIPDKRYQLADWRIRPLPEEMLEYARSDTHFLLFIYDNLRNALLDRALPRSRSSSPHISPPHTTPTSSTTDAGVNPAHSLVNHVLSRSAETCLREYTKDSYDHSTGSGPTGWDTLAKKWNKTLFTASAPDNGITGMQKAVYKAVHWWRERVAREEDESTRYVLPNHFLFRIAEQPPGDLATLLRFFQSSMSGIVKRRAAELLGAIREAVKHSLGDREEKRAEGGVRVMMENEAVSRDVQAKSVGDQDESGTRQSQKETADKLWGADDKTNALLKTSSLFGAARPAAPQISEPTSTYVAPQSALFGCSKTNSARPASNMIRFQELVARINTTMVIAPTVPKTIATSTTQSTTLVETSTEAPTTTLEEATGMQVEIPFVPASQRQTLALKVEEKERDTIVVVGQPRQKKRKRVKVGKGDTDSNKERRDRSKEAVEKEAAGEGGEAFDFDSVPNILDDNPDVEDRKPKKKQKKQARGGQFYGDFPAPPKAHSEFKGGNQSHTFG